MVLVNTVLVSCDSAVIGGSYSFFGSFYLVDFMFFLVWCMWHLTVSSVGGIYLLIRSIFKLVHVAKYHFLIDWMRVCSTGLNIMV